MYHVQVRGSQFQQPLMEFSGACEGCGETPYVKLLTQMFGERMVVANATGCSSIWGGSAPSNPYTVGWICIHCAAVAPLQAAVGRQDSEYQTELLWAQQGSKGLTPQVADIGSTAHHDAELLLCLIHGMQVNPLTGRGPAWANSLFEDNAQFGLGIAVGLKQRRAAYANAVRSMVNDPEEPGSPELRKAFQEWLQVSWSE